MIPLDYTWKLVGRSAAMQRIREQVERVAASHVPVLILGETGTGKELCAEALAMLSGRRPFVALNCAAIPESLVEGQLFGYERGAFTGAFQRHPGLIAAAHGGTLFLDELVELPMTVQAKLLRTLESGEYVRLGSTVTLRSDFRIVAATSGDVDGLVAGGQLRAALVHRLGAFRLCLPPLRDRLEDIPLLAPAFLRGYRERAETGPLRLAPEACALLMQNDWPGNVRQLRNVVEAAAAMAGSELLIGMPHLLQFLAPFLKEAESSNGIHNLADVRRHAEKRAILDAIHGAGGNRERAAKLLGISPATLYRKLRASQS